MHRHESLFAVAILIAAGCHTAAAGRQRSPAASAVVATTGSDTLDWLRAQRSRVREEAARTPDQPWNPPDWRSHDVKPLVGLTRDRIVAALGPPDVCPHANGSPCGFGVAVVYALFYLPDTSLGGGPNLALDFDERGVCTFAKWVLTK